MAIDVSSTSKPDILFSDVLPPGTVLDRHRVEGKLREGGMAMVYLGEHVNTGARVAIKVLRQDFADQEEIVARFDREAHVMGRLSGKPNIVQVHDVGSLPGGRRYLAMEFIRGTDLDDLLNELRSNDERIDIVRACRIMRDVARGIEAAHRNEIVHRDLKPSNIMVEQRRGSDEAAKILDFGVSADLGAKGQAQGLTGVGTVIGTPEYMAPEQAAGIAASPSFDIYAIGVIFFELLTGRSPPGDGWRAGVLPDVKTIRKDVPEALSELVRESTLMDSTKRLQTAAEIVRRLDGMIHDIEGPAARLKKWADGRPMAAAGAVRSSTGPMTPPQQPTIIVRGEPAVPVEVAAPQPAGGSKLVPIVAAVGLLLGAGIVLAVAMRPGETSDPARAATAGGVATPAPHAPPPAAAPPKEAAPLLPAVAPPEAPDTDAAPVEAPQSEDSAAPEEPETAPEAPSAPPDPAPADGASSLRCKASRHDAAAARSTRNWKAVVDQTKDRDCWTKHGSQRRALRVEAFLELRAYDRCIAAAGSSSDPKVGRMLDFCRKMAAK